MVDLDIFSICMKWKIKEYKIEIIFVYLYKPILWLSQV